MTSVKPKTKERTTVYLPILIRQQMVDAAKAAGQPMSTWVERAITGHLQATYPPAANTR